MTEVTAVTDTQRNPLPTRCPYTFRELPDPQASTSPFVGGDLADEPLPEGWQGSGTITFALAGDRSSGKSLYIAVVVKLLKKLVIANGGAFNYADEHTRRVYEEKYEGPLFTEMGLLPSTPPITSPDAHQGRPMIFEVSTPRHPAQRLFVVIRDVAGEDLQEQNFPERRDQLDFFRYADRIIFLFDPKAVSRIRQLLDGSISTHDVGEDGPMVVLRNVLQVLGEDHRPRIAMCLSKFDTMQQLANVDQSNLHYSGTNAVNWGRVMGNYGATFRRDSPAVGEPFDRASNELLDLEIRSTLECLDATDLLNQLSQPLKGRLPYPYQCFAVSALGAEPRADGINSMGIAPFRCLDPFREVFSGIGLFDALPRTEATSVFWGTEVPRPEQQVPVQEPGSTDGVPEKPKKKSRFRRFRK